MLYADPSWCSDDLGDIRWQSRCWEVPDKTAATRVSRSQIGCCKFVPGSWSRCWCAGINSGVVPGFTNCTNCGNHGCVCQQGTITKAVVRSCASFASTLPTILYGGKRKEVRFNQHREKAFTWYASGSGLYDAYLEHLEFRRPANRSISGFLNWSKGTWQPSHLRTTLFYVTFIFHIIPSTSNFCYLISASPAFQTCIKKIVRS